MDYEFIALDGAHFAPLHALDDAALRAQHARRLSCTESPGMPCRVSLEDAAPGETVLLINHLHHDTDSPYRASGPIYVRANVGTGFGRRNEVPTMLRSRLLSLRAYDARGFLRQAEVVDGSVLESGLAAMFASSKVDYVHIHFARPGCYACTVRRAGAD